MRKFIQFLLLPVLMISLLLNGCTNAAFWIANRPVTLEDVTLHKDIAYGSEAGQRLDIYVPQHANNTDAPVVLFFYGGSWSSGNKENYPFVAKALTDLGYIAVIADYRKYPDVTFPAFVADSAKATAWTYRHVAAYGGDQEKLFVMGHSAGAYNAAMMLTDPHYLEAEGLSSQIVKGFAGLAGPYGFTPSSSKYRAIFNNMDDYSAMHVTSYVDRADIPPMLLLHGQSDGTVAVENSVRLHEALQQQGAISELIRYPDINHYEIIGVFTDYWQEKAQIREDIDQFFQSRLTE